MSGWRLKAYSPADPEQTHQINKFFDAVNENCAFQFEYFSEQHMSFFLANR